MRLTGHPAAMIRPERVRFGTAPGARTAATVSELQYFGAFYRIRCETLGAEILVDHAAHLPLAARVGDPVYLHWDADAIHPLENAA
jgi:putative spermidine/putrescine transport system ATP-binding protein